MKMRVGVFGLTGCWGEQVVLLACEDQLLALVELLDFIDFLGASSRNDTRGPLDIALVEGAVSSARDEETLARIRARARTLVACGSCACFGGLAAIDEDAVWRRGLEAVYGPGGQTFGARPHRPLRDFVSVDVELVGCPIEKEELLQTIACLTQGDTPPAPTTPVCHDCRLAEHDCLLQTHGLPCAGPVTASGCNARCPGYNLPCIGCRGPVTEANLEALRDILRARGVDDDDLAWRLRLFSCWRARPVELAERQP